MQLIFLVLRKLKHTLIKGVDLRGSIRDKVSYIEDYTVLIMGIEILCR